MSNYFTDLSSNNGPDFNPRAYASAGYVGVALKATEGDHYVNPYYAKERQWVRDSHRHNLPVFHYMFARPEDGNPRGQVEHFWETVREHFRRPGDFVVIDLETHDPVDGWKWWQSAKFHLEVISGTRPITYTYLSYFSGRSVSVQNVPIWMAAYQRSRPGSWRWRLPGGALLWAWQYSDGHGFGPGPQRFAGVPGTSDGSLLNPSIAKVLHRQRRPH